MCGASVWNQTDYYTYIDIFLNTDVSSYLLNMFYNIEIVPFFNLLK